MSSGGGGGSGTTKYEWNDDMAQYWRPALAQGAQLAGQPYQPYTGQRIAGINADQQMGMDAIRNFAINSGSPVTKAANGQLQQTLDGYYLTGLGQDQYADALNPWALESANVNRNQYAGSSPQFEAMLQTGREGITDAYKQGTSADTTRMFNLAGAFGGSAHQNAVANNEAALAKQLGAYDTSMRNDQFNRSAGLEESFLGRDLQNSQFDKQLGSQLEENRLNRGTTAFQNERNRQMEAVPYGQHEQDMALDRYRSVIGIGDAQRGFNQDVLNQQYNDWQDALNYPQRQMDWLTGLLSRAQGGISANSTTTPAGYSASPFSQVIGAGLLGRAAGLY